MKNFLGTDIKWLWTMRKLNTPFSVSTYPRGSEMGTIVWGYPKPLSTIWYDNGDIYFEENEIACIRKFLEYKYYQDRNYSQKVSSDIFNLVKKIKKQSINIDGVDSLDELVKLLDSNSEYFFKLIGYISYRGAVQMCDVLEEKIINMVSFRLAAIDKLNQTKDFLAALTSPLYPSIVMEEKIAVLKLSQNFSHLSEKKQEEVISRYISEYEWLSYHWLVGKPLDRGEVRSKLLAEESNSQVELEKIKEDYKKQEEEILDIVKLLKFDRKDKALLKELRTWVFMRTFIKDNINLAGYKLLSILRKIGQKVGVEADDIVWLTYDEIVNISKLKITDISTLIAKRKNGFSAGTIDNVLIFDDFSKYNLNNPNSQEVSQEREIKGSIAFKGVVRGVARVIMFPKDQERLQPGEILVTSMTTPDYLPAMGKAAAFVTDEGGITCHAAIVAREMKKPCIIGTKNATKIIQDGDLVEVDAEKGVVRKMD